MANVSRSVVNSNGVGNSVFYGNEINANIALIARNCCCQRTNSLGQNIVTVEDIVPESGVSILKTFLAPVITLKTEDATSLSNLALTKPNQAALGNGCDIVTVVVINASGVGQAFDIDVQVSRVKKTDTNPILEPDCAYVLHYNVNEDLWTPSCKLGLI